MVPWLPGCLNASGGDVVILDRPVETPALLLDLDVMEGNISRMADIARRGGVNLRPHIKTHKSLPIAHRQLVQGRPGGNRRHPGGGRIDGPRGHPGHSPRLSPGGELEACPAIGLGRLDSSHRGGGQHGCGKALGGRLPKDRGMTLDVYVKSRHRPWPHGQVPRRSGRAGPGAEDNWSLCT
jgi:hypothetical protein